MFYIISQIAGWIATLSCRDGGRACQKEEMIQWKCIANGSNAMQGADCTVIK